LPLCSCPNGTDLSGKVAFGHTRHGAGRQRFAQTHICLHLFSWPSADEFEGYAKPVKLGE
jgi:hypothetical protein